MIEDKSFTFRLPLDLFDEAQSIAKSIDLSLAQLLRRALREYLDGVGRAQTDN